MATVEERLAYLEAFANDGYAGRLPTTKRAVANSFPDVSSLSYLSSYTGDLYVNGNISIVSPGRITDTLGNYWDYSTGFNWKQKLYPGTGSALNTTKYLEYNVADGGLHTNGSLFIDNNLYPGGGVVRSIGDNGTELTLNGSVRVNSGDVIVPAGELYFDSLTNNTVTEIIKAKSSSGPIGAIKALSDSGGSGKSTVYLQGTVTTLSSTQNTWRLGAGGGSESGGTGGIWYSYDTNGFSLPQVPLITYDGTRSNMWLPTRTYPGGGSTRYLSDDGSRSTFSGDVATGNIYPGLQTTRYISDDGTRTTTSSDFKAGGKIYPSNQTTQYIEINAGTGNMRVSANLEIGSNLELNVAGAQAGTTGTGALPNPTKWLSFFNVTANAVWYIPCYGSYLAWTA